MFRLMLGGVLLASVFVLAGCGPKLKPCADFEAAGKVGMTKEEIIAALGEPNESGPGLAGDYMNYNCGGGEQVSFILRRDKVSSVVNIAKSP
jgi:hypothetical protein